MNKAKKVQIRGYIFNEGLASEEKVLTLMGMPKDSIEFRGEVNGVSLKRAIEDLLDTLRLQQKAYASPINSKATLSYVEMFRMRVGLSSPSGESKTLEEVSEVSNVTKERVRQCEGRIIRMLRHQSRKQYLEPYIIKKLKSD